MNLVDVLLVLAMLVIEDCAAECGYAYEKNVLDALAQHLIILVPNLVTGPQYTYPAHPVSVVYEVPVASSGEEDTSLAEEIRYRG